MYSSILLSLLLSASGLFAVRGLNLPKSIIEIFSRHSRWTQNGGSMESSNILTDKNTSEKFQILHIGIVTSLISSYPNAVLASAKESLQYLHYGEYHSRTPDYIIYGVLIYFFYWLQVNAQRWFAKM